MTALSSSASSSRSPSGVAVNIPPEMYKANPDAKDHYGVIIIGSGFSGLAANIQLKRKAGFTDVICYEREADFGGTWCANTYPGAACDIPVGLYSFSFAKKPWTSNWAGQKSLLKYMHDVADEHNIRNIVLRTSVLSCDYSSGIWTVKIKNLDTGEEKTKTCNILISAVGGLREPSLPGFAMGEAAKEFEGAVFHTARWDHSVDIKGKKVVLVGNGCSAAQIVPAVLDDVASLTQVARSRQTYVPHPVLPENKYWYWALRWIPGLLFLQRALIYFAMESYFIISDIHRGVSKRSRQLGQVLNHINSKASPKFREALTPDFDLGAKRRIFDSGYVEATNNPKFDLVQDDAVVKLNKKSVTTLKGREIEADVVVLSTGFKVQDFFFPLKVTSSTGEELVHRLKSEVTPGKMYRGTLAHGFPNFFVLQGPNTATGHSSVIFTSEAQINMILSVTKPILRMLKEGKVDDEKRPTVEIKEKAEEEYYKMMRAEMKKKVWEKDGGVSWYVDSKTRLCIALYPWSQTNFWYHATFPTKSHFKWTNCA
ncbi:FAD/NAD(P)-binding domain-containing protein [Meredithblackwellia eburnea MCA 4105]